MSALDSSVVTARVIYCYDPNTGVAELKGGVNWILGDDTTGDGRAIFPYATPDQALQEIRTQQGQSEFLQSWEIRLVTDDDEASEYGSITATNYTTYPETGTAFNVIFTGWLKAFGDPVYGNIGGTWATIAEKPAFEFYVANTASDGLKRSTWKNIRFINSTSAEDIDINSNDSISWYLNLYGCTHEGVGSGNGRVRLGSAAASPVVSYTACTFINALVNLTAVTGGTNQKIQFVNCYWHNTSKNAFDFIQGGGNVKEPFNINCIFNMNGSGLLVYNNTGTTDRQATESKNCNRYFLQGGADWGKFASGSSVISSFTPTGDADDFSSEGDPDIVSDSNPALEDTSLILDKGCIPDVIVFFAQTDFSGNNYHDFDALNFPWGDVLSSDTIDVGGEIGKFSQRGVGPIQNSLGFVPPSAPIASPKNQIAFSPEFLAAKVTADPDGLGTCQPRFLQADNIDLDVNLVIKDAWPLNITTGNNKIDFKEDGGAELTAVISTGIKDTATLLADIITAMEAVGAGTYAVTYDGLAGGNTQLMTMAVSGAITNFEILGATGTNVLEFFFPWSGYDAVDTGSNPSHIADEITLEKTFTVPSTSPLYG